MTELTELTELTLTKERQSIFWSLIRSTPISLLGALVLINIIYPTIDNFMFMIFYSLTFGSNMIFKVIAKGIYTVLNTNYIPFIGQGTRPSGAHSCSSFISIPLMPAISFGMPSGHSQLAWFFAVYACLIVIYNKNHSIINLTKNKVIVSCILLILLAIIISYSRVSIEGCHTTGQVVVGGLIGIVIALAAFWVTQYRVIPILKLRLHGTA